MKFIPLLFCLFLCTYCSNKEDFITPKRKTIVETVFASGVIEPLNLVSIHSSVPGILQSIAIKEGDSLLKGATMFELQTTGAEYQVQSALANQQYTHRAFSENSPQIQAIQEEITVSKKRFEYDSSLFAKKTQLFKERAISSQELETSRLAFESSRAGFQSTKYKFDATKKALLRDKNVSIAQYNIAKTSANNFRITALQSGFVWSVPMTVGASITPTQPLALIGDKNNFILKLQVDPSDVGLIKIGQKVLYTIDAIGDSIYVGFVVRILPSINEKTQTYEVEAECPGLQLQIIKSAIEANIVIAEKKNALVIPREYLYGTSIYTSSTSDKPSPLNVQIGLKNLELVEIVDKKITEQTRIYLKPL